MSDKECEEQSSPRSMDRYESQCFTLKVFGCVAYAHIPDELRKKLDKKVQKCIFVGYLEDTKAYKLYDPVTRKVIISRDVQFVENESWDGTVDTNVNIVSNIDNDDMEE